MEDKEETFGQWLGKLVYELRISPEVEAVGGVMLVGIVASIVLAVLLSPWWLIVTIPGGVLLFLHGVWREDI